jgi:2-aminoethylphosphonate-pyruvate transaminase
MKLEDSTVKNGHQNGYIKNGASYQNGHSHTQASYILLNPGPVVTSAKVRQAMTRGDICHRDSAFSELLSRVQEGLKRVADAPQHEAILLSGGGTAATEAAFSTFLSTKQKLLVVSNGAFGERLAEIANVLGLPLVHVKHAWGKEISPSEIEALLSQHPDVRAVAMIHHETSVGRLNPIQEVGAMLAPRGVRFIVDVISSLGGEVISAKNANISVMIGSANKCLHSVPGVSFLLVDNVMWEDAKEIAARSVFLDIKRYRAAARENKQTPFTPAVHAIVALDEAIKELEAEGGPAARRAKYLSLNTKIRNTLQSFGYKPAFEGASLSSSLTVAHLRPGETFDALYETMRKRGYIIYAAKGPIQDTCFIVANMGCLDHQIIDAFLASLAEVCGVNSRSLAQI